MVGVLYDRPRKKLRNESDTSDVSWDFKIVDLTKDYEADEEDLYEREDPYSFQ
jgi:hypothetical protein